MQYLYTKVDCPLPCTMANRIAIKTVKTVKTVKMIKMVDHHPFGRITH